ncbi:MAG: N-succinylarginine dihydrolase [Alphaproteobacteria bacterium]|nr:MAG: N-succinylarginine dihydrolase [Alphaproteobacteria bacterium]TAF76965.1 MAG: N-succinylarginine dihydrolase [Alphaproteobacteria bacterium]
MPYFEVQCDGLIGPTHNYAGLSFGNVASAKNAQGIAYPRQAALQGIAKMRFVAGLGIKQLIAPPPLRPNLAMLADFGLSYDTDIAATLDHPLHRGVVRAAASASTMWTANAAMVSPAPDCTDGALHITIANLASALHRSQEAQERLALFRIMFGDVANIHVPLPSCTPFTDEGAANHMRLCSAHHHAGVEIFVYGRDDGGVAPARYPARQTRKACEAIIALHHLPEERTLLVQQHPDAIDAGVFHNDVIAMSNETVLIYHEQSFLHEDAFLSELHQKAEFPLCLIRISEDEMPIRDAVESYFYNSQLLSVGAGRMVIVAPTETRDNHAANAAMQRIIADKSNPIDAVHYLDVRESMRNGGGPACLRLRLVMEESAWRNVPACFHAMPEQLARLEDMIARHYPEELPPEAVHRAHFATDMHAIYQKIVELFPPLAKISHSYL